MGKAKSEATTVRLVPEVAWGTNPGAYVGATGVGAWTIIGVNPGGITGFESNNTYVERDPLSVYASREKGDLVGRTVAPKLTHDLVKDWMDLHAAAIFRSLAKHAGNTNQSKYRPTAAVDGGGSADSFTVPANGALTAGLLVEVRGFTNAANNGVFVVAAGSGATNVNVPTASLVAEAAPPANVSLEVVGVQGGSGDITLNASGHLTATTLNFTTLGLTVGQGIIIGGSAVGNQFATIGQGRAFIKTIAASLIELEDRSFAIGADAGAGKTIRLGFTRFHRNVPINHADYLEQYLHAEKEEIGPGTANAAIFTEASGLGVKTFEINVPLEAKIVTTASYVGKSIPDPVLAANRIAGPSTAFVPLAIALVDTSSDTKKVRLLNASDSSELAADINNFTLTFENNIEALKTLGNIDAQDLIYGKFDVSLSMQAYFSDWNQAKALNDNRDLRWDAYHANHQVALWWRLPYCALRGGARSYPANSVVTIDMMVPGFRDPTTNVVASLSVCSPNI